MEEPPIINEPPVISEPPRIPSPPAKRPAFEQAALVSVIAPLCAIGLNIVVGAATGGGRLSSLIIGCTSTLLILLGFVCGIVAFVAAKKHGSKDIRLRALIGTCINGAIIVLCLAALPGLIRAMERAKELHRQRMEQRQR